MNIHCLCIVKNEDDIIGDVLEQAAVWADNIYIVDNGSTDNTQKMIEEKAQQYTNIHYLGVRDEPFTDEIRGKIFQEIQQHSKIGDWWCRLDADEFYIDNPRDFLKQLAPHVDHVWGASYQFYFTETDFERYEQDKVAFLAQPLEQRFSYYKNNWSEIRFAKHTNYFNWPANAAWPTIMVSPSSQRIRLRTYQYRSPEQIIKRLTLRRQIVEQTQGRVFSHIMNAEQKQRFNHDGGLISNNDEKTDEITFKEAIKPTTGFDFLEADNYIAHEDLMPSFFCKPLWLPAQVWYFIKLTSESVFSLIRGIRKTARA